MIVYGSSNEHGVIARTLSEVEGDVAISRYDVCYCTADRWMVPGDSHGPYGASE